MRPSPFTPIDALGRATLSGGRLLLDLAGFVFLALSPQRLRGWSRDPARRGAIATQIVFSGIDALPLLFLLALAAGIGFGGQLLVLLDPLTEDTQTLEILIHLVGLELAPLLTAFLLLARSGTAMAVELANMAQRRELEGLMLLQVDPIALFATPRLIAMALSQLALAILFATVALASAIAFAALTESTSLFRLLPQLPAALPPLALLLFVLRNLLFGLVIAASACLQGLTTGPLATEVPQHTQRAVVSALLLIFLLDGLFAALMLS
ncbi:MAG TPA: ABC transporter permease [Chromatiales bacterium]|nr:ABC transporter permease [Chromatiales bacterium]